jgi:sugar O-acyltransferase (sialic acid O-acetyltransferase NeuD family)
MKTDLIIIGAGGHAKVLIDCLEQQPDVTILGILDNNQNMHDKLVLGVRVLGGDDKIADYDPAKVQLVNALGSVDIPLRRKALFSQFKSVGFRFYSVIHASAIIAPSVQLGEGVQVMAGAILQPDCKIGANVIINTGASLDHDVTVEDNVHIAPGVVVSGNVYIETDSHIGARAVILQGMQIGQRCLVGAGAVVIHNISQDSRVVGVPAKRINSITENLAHEQLE